MLQKGVGQAQIAFGIFKINGVDFVRHGTGSHFTRLDFLLEIIHGNVRPNVAAQINQDGVDALQVVKVGRQVVVVFDLRGGEGAVQSQGFRDELIRKRMPILIWIGGVVGVEIARSTTEFSAKGNARQEHALLVDPCLKHANFLAQTGRGGGLTVGARQQRNGAPGSGGIGQKIHHLVQQREVYLLVEILQR